MPASPRMHGGSRKDTGVCKAPTGLPIQAPAALPQKTVPCCPGLPNSPGLNIAAALFLARRAAVLHANPGAGEAPRPCQQGATHRHHKGQPPSHGLAGRAADAHWGSMYFGYPAIGSAVYPGQQGAAFSVARQGKPLPLPLLFPFFQYMIHQILPFANPQIWVLQLQKPADTGSLRAVTGQQADQPAPAAHPAHPFGGSPYQCFAVITARRGHHQGQPLPIHRPGSPKGYQAHQFCCA